MFICYETHLYQKTSPPVQFRSQSHKTYFYQQFHGSRKEKEEVYNYERNCDGQSGNNV